MFTHKITKSGQWGNMLNRMRNSPFRPLLTARGAFCKQWRQHEHINCATNIEHRCPVSSTSQYTATVIVGHSMGGHRARGEIKLVPRVIDIYHVAVFIKHHSFRLYPEVVACMVAESKYYVFSFNFFWKHIFCKQI